MADSCDSVMVPSVLSDREKLESSLFQMLENEEVESFMNMFLSAPESWRHNLANSKDKSSDVSNTLLSTAVEKNQLQLCSFLLNNGASANLPNSWETYPLHYAAQEDVDAAIMKLLIDKGADSNVKNKVSDTPLHDVCEYYQPEKTEILLASQPDVNASNQTSDRPLHRATKLIDDKDHQCVNVIKSLIQAGADVNAKGKDEATPLHHAALNHSTEALVCLLENGASVNSLDVYGDTPIQHASLQVHMYSKQILTEAIDNHLIDVSGTEKTIRALIDQGGDINQVNTLGVSVIHRAATTASELVDLIIKYGGDIRIRDYLGRNVLHYCITYSFSYSEQRLHQIKQTCKTLIKYGISVNEPDMNGFTPLHHSVEIPSYFMMKTLIEEGATVNTPNKNGTVPLHIAMRWNDMRFANLLHSSGADVNATDNNGSTVAHYAAWYSKSSTDYPNCIQFLRKVDVKLDLQDGQGHTALDVAAFVDNCPFYEGFDENSESTSHDSDGSEKEFSDLEEGVCDQEEGNEMKHEQNDHEIDESIKDLIEGPKAIKVSEIPQFLKEFESNHGKWLEDILEYPYFDKIANSEEAILIRATVTELIGLILKKVAQLDDRFEATAVLSGSVSEDTKIFLPNEFDYLCCLHKFDMMTIIDETDPNKPPCFTSLRLNLNSKYMEYAEFFHNSHLQQNWVSSRFYNLVQKVISKTKLWSHFPKISLQSGPKVAKGSISSLSVTWTGWLIKDMEISIDFVPSIPKRNWWPLAVRRSPLLTDEHISSLGCLLITKADKSKKFEFEPKDVMAKFLRISFSEVETHLIQKQSKAMKQGYKLAKYMVELVPPFKTSDTNENLKREARALISSYMLKTCLFHLIHKLGNNPQPIDARLTHNEQVQTWAFLIYEEFERLLEDDKVSMLPSFFIPEYNLISLEDTTFDNSKQANQMRLEFCKLIKQMLTIEQS